MTVCVAALIRIEGLHPIPPALSIFGNGPRTKVLQSVESCSAFAMTMN
jgi:hypothetical protein